MAKSKAKSKAKSAVAKRALSPVEKAERISGVTDECLGVSADPGVASLEEAIGDFADVVALLPDDAPRRRMSGEELKARLRQERREARLLEKGC